MTDRGIKYQTLVLLRQEVGTLANRLEMYYTSHLIIPHVTCHTHTTSRAKISHYIVYLLFSTSASDTLHHIPHHRLHVVLHHHMLRLIHPLCDIPSGCCSSTGPWTVTRSSLRMLRRVAAFCRPLWPVLLLVSFPRSRSPVVGVLGLC